MGLVSCGAHAADLQVARWEQLIQLNGLPDNRVPVVTAVAIQPHGDLLATAGDDHAVRLWNMHTGRMVRRLDGHQDWVTAVTFCSDGSELITGGRDRNVFVWDVATGELVGSLGKHQHPISAIVASQEKDIVAVVGFQTDLKIFDAGSRKLLATLACPCTDMRAVAFSPDLRFMAAGGRNGRIRVWDLKSAQNFDLLAHSRRVRALTFSADGQKLISAGEDQLVRIWDVESHAIEHTILTDLGKVLSMTMIGKDQFATASSDNSIRLFRLDAEEPYTTLSGHTGSIAALVFHDGKLISGSFDTTVRVWSLADQFPTANIPSAPPKLHPTAIK